MKKVLVIGCPGAGKSTFARKLRDKLNLPLYYLDMIWHKPDKTTYTKEEFDSKLASILKEDEWIIDGNYSRTLETRIQKCDTVFYLDLPVEDCLKGAKSRVGTIREDLPWVEDELDPEFREWIKEFPNVEIPIINEIVNRYKDSINLIVFKSRNEADNYIKEL